MIPHLNDTTTMLASSSSAQPTLLFGTSSTSHSHPIQDVDRDNKRQKPGAVLSSAWGIDGTSSANSSSSRNSSTNSNSNLPQPQLLNGIGKKYRQVHFAPVQLSSIHSTERTQEDIATSWYSKEELAVFKCERKVFVKALKKVKFDLQKLIACTYNQHKHTHKHTLRGFEAYFSIQANKEYKVKRQMVWQAVLQEQSRQRHLGQQDPIMLQLISRHATQWARDTATKLGSADAQGALQIFMDHLESQQRDHIEDQDQLKEEQLLVVVVEEQGRLETPPSPLEEDTSMRDTSMRVPMSDNSLQVQQFQFDPLQLSSQELNRARLDPHHHHHHHNYNQSLSSCSSYNTSTTTSSSSSNDNSSVWQDNQGSNTYMPHHLS